MVLAAVRTVFAQPDAASAAEQLDEIVDKLTPRFPAVAELLAEAGVTRLAGAVLLELHDEWQVVSRRYLSEGSMALLDRPADDDATKEVDGARARLLAS